MNDPGLDEPLQNSAKEAEDRLRGDLRQRGAKLSGNHGSHRDDSPAQAFREQLVRNDDEEEDASLAKRWWFTSTAFPLFAGTFGPLANLMSICALVQSWRVEFVAGDSETIGRRIADPPWLLAINGVSLAFAIVANLLLLLNFAHRVTYKIAQPLTIVFWYISSFTLVALVIASHRHLRLSPKTHAFSQSFYYGILSAGLYFFISTLLLWHLLGAYYFKAYRASFTSLTISQRTLMLQTIMYSLYLALGAGLFSHLEGWEFVDGVYWADYSLLTIGLGSDFQLKGTLSRGLFLPYAVSGIIMIGLIIGSVRGLVLDRGKTRVRLRALEKARLRVIRELESDDCDWRREFELMRSVQDIADQRRRYIGLAISFVAFAIVWFGGALIFHYTESNSQNWTYFEALYFSYTTLLTIGYGDFYPQSNSGKPFFVLWSLLAVPSVTILISNMGDTVVSWIKHGTLWLGQKTILPERATTGGESKTGTTSSTETDQEKREPDTERDARPCEGARRFAGEGRRGDKRQSVLAEVAREVRRLSKDINKTPKKRYDWDTWSEWLRILGDDDEERREWRWLGPEGPLMSGLTEAEWVLGRMCERLDQAVTGHRDRNGHGHQD